MFTSSSCLTVAFVNTETQLTVHTCQVYIVYGHFERLSAAYVQCIDLLLCVRAHICIYCLIYTRKALLFIDY
jgi:hypothetical protein